MPRQPRLETSPPRVLLLAGTGSYRKPAFLEAADRLGIDAIDVVDIPEPFESISSGTISVDYIDADAACARVAELAIQQGARAILAIDDSAALIAAMASQHAGIPHNDPDSVLASRDKLVMRQKLADYGAPVPWFREVPLTADLVVESKSIEFPCVVKPTRLSGSRGVIRADNPDSFAAAFERTRSIIIADGSDPATTSLIVEQYLPGDEVAVEALLTDGELEVLAIFDKPDPLTGPFFEETIYVTPSRLPENVQRSIAERTAEAAAATGIRHGPVHAELRIGENGIVVIEIAGRSIGGMCSTILEFGAGQSLEEIILLNATQAVPDLASRSTEAVGVMMIPIPKSGILRCVDNLDLAGDVPGITDVQVTAKLNARISALPEGSSYLGFIFARGDSPSQVESALRLAHELLEIRIDTMIPLTRMV